MTLNLVNQQHPNVALTLHLGTALCPNVLARLVQMLMWWWLQLCDSARSRNIRSWERSIATAGRIRSTADSPTTCVGWVRCASGTMGPHDSIECDRQRCTWLLIALFHRERANHRRSNGVCMSVSLGLQWRAAWAAVEGRSPLSSAFGATAKA